MQEASAGHRVVPVFVVVLLVPVDHKRISATVAAVIIDPLFVISLLTPRAVVKSRTPSPVLAV